MGVGLRTYIIFAISIILAMVLTILPLPEWAVWYRPEWVALTIIYWCMFVPLRINVGAAWVIGLLMDALHGVILGQTALLLTLLAYVVARFHQPLRVLPMWQQSIAVLALLILYQVGMYLLQGYLGEVPRTWAYFFASITSAIIWPWLYLLLRDCRRRLQIA